VPDTRPFKMTLYCVLLPFVLSSGCALPYPQIPASGVVHGQQVETHVDSELAAYYLEHFDDWRRSDSEEARQLAQLPPCSDASLERESLRQIALQTSVDVAGLYSAGCLMDANRDLGSEFQRVFSELKSDPAPGASLGHVAGFAIVVVPGWDYVESGEITGGDFARQLRQFGELGIANYRIEINQNGGVEENAAFIRHEVVRISRSHENIVLVSASSGSPAVAHALGDRETHAELANVRAWLNIGGILGGMRLIDSYSGGVGRLVLRAFSWFEGWDIEDVDSMSAARSLERLARMELPEGLVIINYIGIPFSGDISERVSFFYSRLRELGPNDGLTLVTDPILPGTHTLVALGQDHFFADDPELETRTVALASVVATLVGRERRAASNAHPTVAPCPQLAQTGTH